MLPIDIKSISQINGSHSLIGNGSKIAIPPFRLRYHEKWYMWNRAFQSHSDLFFWVHDITTLDGSSTYLAKKK